MTDAHAHHSHFAVLYHVPDGCVIAEVNGPVVSQFGPFAEDVAPRELAAALFDEMPLVILSAQPAKLDDDAVLILGNRACQAPRPANE